MAGYDLNQEKREAEAEAGFRNFPILQPVVEARDPISNAIRDFVHEERQKNFAFLGQYSHTNSDEQVFRIEIGNIAAIKGICRRRRYDLAKHLGDPVRTNVRCYTFRANIFDIAKTMPVRLLEASVATSLTVTTIGALSTEDWTSVDRQEDEEMLNVITASEGEGNVLVPAFSRPTVPCEPRMNSQAPVSIWVEGQADDAMVDIGDVIADGEGSSEHVSIKDIQVLDWLNDGEWMSVGEWMRKEFNYNSDTYDWKVPQNQLEEQTIWWENNDLSFRLLDLPGELRNLVYIHIIGNVILPKVKANDIWPSQDQPGLIRKDHRLTFGSGHHYLQQYGQARHDPNVERPNLAILRSCKQVHDEVIGAVWNGAVKRFRDTDFLKNSELPEGFPFMQYANIVPKVSSTQYALHNVQLELSATQFSLLIGIAPTVTDPWATTTSGLQIDALKSIPSLTRLDFRFMSPKHADARCPWSSRAPKKHSCQKIWIDYFLTHAFSHLRRSASLCSALLDSDSGLYITLSGCIKTSTRTKWEKIFSNERRGLTDYNNRHRVEETKRMHARFEPIPCQCRMPCVSASDPWSRFDEDDRRAIVGLEDEISEAYWSFRD